MRVAHFFDHDANKLFRAIDDQQFQRFVQFTVDRPRQDLRLADLKLIALAPHHLNQNGELEFAAPHHFEGVGAARLLDSDGDVGQQFLVKPVAQIARGDKLAFAPANGEC